MTCCATGGRQSREVPQLQDSKEAGGSTGSVSNGLHSLSEWNLRMWIWFCDTYISLKGRSQGTSKVHLYENTISVCVRYCILLYARKNHQQNVSHSSKRGAAGRHAVQEENNGFASDVFLGTLLSVIGPYYIMPCIIYRALYLSVHLNLGLGIVQNFSISIPISFISDLRHGHRTWHRHWHKVNRLDSAKEWAQIFSSTPTRYNSVFPKTQAEHLVCH